MKTFLWLGTTRFTKGYISSLSFLFFFFLLCIVGEMSCETTFVHKEKFKWFGPNAAEIQKFAFTYRRIFVLRVTRLLLGLDDQVLSVGSYRGGFWDKLPGASSMSDRANANWLQERTVTGQGQDHQWQ